MASGDDPPKSNVARYRLTPGIAQQRIRLIALNSEAVILGTHARERMIERDIVDIDVFRVLRTGCIEGLPELTEQDEWKCKMVHQIRGGRSAGVVTIILQGQRLFIKTVEWEDER